MLSDNSLAIDLFCGLGGWTEGLTMNKPVGDCHQFIGPTMNQVLHRFAGFVWEMRNVSPITSDSDLLRIATAVRDHITLGGKSGGYCAVVCVPLAVFLTRYGRPAVDVHGAVGEWQHTWIELEDGRIIDPTADQFNRVGAQRMPPVYLGNIPAHYMRPEQNNSKEMK